MFLKWQTQPPFISYRDWNLIKRDIWGLSLRICASSVRDRTFPPPQSPELSRGPGRHPRRWGPGTLRPPAGDPTWPRTPHGAGGDGDTASPPPPDRASGDPFPPPPAVPSATPRAGERSRWAGGSRGPGRAGRTHPAPPGRLSAAVRAGAASPPSPPGSSPGPATQTCSWCGRPARGPGAAWRWRGGRGGERATGSGAQSLRPHRGPIIRKRRTSLSSHHRAAATAPPYWHRHVTPATSTPPTLPTMTSDPPPAVPIVVGGACGGGGAEGGATAPRCGVTAAAAAGGRYVAARPPPAHSGSWRAAEPVMGTGALLCAGVCRRGRSTPGNRPPHPRLLGKNCPLFLSLHFLGAKPDQTPCCNARCLSGNRSVGSWVGISISVRAASSYCRNYLHWLSYNYWKGSYITVILIFIMLLI